jgi:hypothetical protein
MTTLAFVLLLQLQPLPIPVMDLGIGVNPQLVPDSLYSRKATDGTDLGANFDIAGVIDRAVNSIEAPQAVADVRNPSGVEFEPSADHAQVDSYELDILRPDGSVLQTINLGKPAVASGVCAAPLNVQPVAFGKDYRVRVRAIAGGSASDYTVSVNKFERAPGAPSKGIVK